MKGKSKKVKGKRLTSPLLRPLVCLVFLWCASQAQAQTTLFNIPATDVVEKGKTYLEFDFLSHLASHRNGGFQTYAARGVYGVAKRVEAGANLVFTDAAAPNQPVEVQPNVKVRLYANEKTGVAIASGGLLYAPVVNRRGTDTFGLLYTVASKRFAGKYGPRVTGGGYRLAGRQSNTGTQGGAIVGYEQPLARKVTAVADWLSGKNRFGYVTGGFAFTLPRNSAFYIGYSVGNEGRKNNALFAFYGITF